MSDDFLLPDLAEGLAEAEIVTWHVGVGDHVVAGQPLVSVETDKSVVEVPSPRAGTIASIHGEPGDIVPVGAPLVTFAPAGGVPADAGSVVGRLPSSDAAASPAPPPAAPPAPAPADSGAGTERRPPAAAPAGHASPAVRSLAHRLGVDLAGLSGTGPDGSITRSDVEAAAGTGGTAPIEPLRGVRRAMAANMTTSHREVVPATVHDLADISAWAEGTDPTMRLVRAIGVAATEAPALNVAFLGTDRGRRLQAEVHVGVAVETDAGLFVPVLRDVTNRDVDDLRAGLDRLRADVAARSIPPEELTGATITLSNFGMHGGLYASMVILPPQVAIVGAGRIHDAVVAKDGGAAVARALPVSLTFDHRVVTGVEATGFLRALLTDLQNPS